MNETILERLRSRRVVIADGAMGTLLYERGTPKGHCYDELNISNPALIKSIHREYADAGAELIETNTFGANRFVLSKYYDLASRAFEVNLAGAWIAREACPECYIAGSVGPVSRPLDTAEVLDQEQLAAIYGEQICALVEGGVDLIILETMSDLEEAKIALREALRVSKVPVAVQMSFVDSDETLRGFSPAQALVELADLGAMIVGANCGLGPQATVEVVKKMAGRRDTFVSAMPNAGTARYTGGRFSYPHNPEYFASCAEEMVNLGVSVIGGCCGTTPEHILALRDRVAGKNVPSPRPRVVSVETSVKPAAPPLVQTRLKEIVSRKFTVMVELSPPKGSKLSEDIESARQLVQAGVDAVSITESPMARIRMSPVALGHSIKSEVGTEVILHFTCRDRNILGLQADLLSVYALGMDNILALTGDPPSVGDYPFATGVYEVNSRGLVEIVGKLNSGLDYLGNGLSSPTGFWVGVAASPTADDSEGELKRLEEKLEAGAGFVMTQPVFDVDQFSSFLRAANLKDTPTIAGVLPLVSSRQAEFLHNEVPGITIPESIRHTMSAGSDREARKTGISIAAGLVQELSSVVAGVCIMAPLRRLEVVREVLELLRLPSASGDSVPGRAPDRKANHDKAKGQ